MTSRNAIAKVSRSNSVQQRSVPHNYGGTLNRIGDNFPMDSTTPVNNKSTFSLPTDTTDETEPLSHITYIYLDTKFEMTFGGKSIDDFIEHCNSFESYASQRFGKNYDRWASEFVLTLTGEIQDTAKMMHMAMEEYFPLKKYMIKYYRMNPQWLFIDTELYNSARMGKDETPDVFAIRLRCLYLKAFPENCDPDIMHSDLVSKFLERVPTKLARRIKAEINIRKFDCRVMHWDDFKDILIMLNKKSSCSLFLKKYNYANSGQRASERSQKIKRSNSNPDTNCCSSCLSRTSIIITEPSQLDRAVQCDLEH